MRQAINYALNQQEIIDVVLEGRGQVANSVMNVNIPGYSEEITGYSQDLEKAKALMAEAGYPDGFDLNLYISNTPTRVKMATLFQAYLQQNLNVNVNINTSEWGPSARLALPDRQMCLVCHGHGIRTPTSS